MRPCFRLYTALLSLTLFAVPALRADVTMRYKTEVTLNPTLPPQIAQQATQGMDASMPKETKLQFRNGKGVSWMGANISICDFTRQQMTLVDTQGKRYATLPFAKFADEMARAMPEMPEAAKAMLATMKSHFESKATGRTATIQGVEGEEREVVMTVDAPSAPNVPPGAMFRLVMHIWTAKSSETLRVPAVREVAGYNLFANAAMNPMASMEKAFRQMPGFADNLGAIVKEMQSGGTPVLLRMQMEMFMPMIGAMLKRAPEGKNPFGAGFDADAPFVTMNQELVELSTAAVPESVFEIPNGYQPAQAADILKAIMAKAQAAANQAQHPIQ